MEPASTDAEKTRPLTAEERELTRWMLQHGTAEAMSFLDQLDRAQAMTWRCPCGCASFNFKIEGYPPAPPGIHVLSEFNFSYDGEIAGIFVCQSGGILGGVELVGYKGPAPISLPSPMELKTPIYSRTGGSPSSNL